MNRNRKIIIISTTVLAVAISTSAIFYNLNHNKKDTVSYSKETTVEKGNLTTGVTESGSVTVGTNDQTFDLDLSGSSESTESSSSSSSTGSTSGSSGSTSSGTLGSSSGGGMTGMSSVQSQGSSSSSSSSSSGSLEVEEVYVSVGQKVTKGDKLLKLTDESVSETKDILEDALASAKLDLKDANITDHEAELDAQNTYDATVAAGKVAKSVYNATIDSIENNIESLESQIEDTSDEKQLESLESQLEEAQEEEATKKLEAKQTYEQTLFDYENAQTIYDIAMDSVGDATKEAQELLDTATENLTKFKTFVGSKNIIYAQYTGTITVADYAKGDILSSDVSLAQFGDTNSTTISVDVTQDDISIVNLKDNVSVTFISDEENTYEGVVSAIGAATTTSDSTVSYPVTITLTTMPEKVLTGMTANVTFITKSIENIIYVSNKAIEKDGTASYVILKNTNGTKTKTKVTTGFSDGINVEIKDGLSEGDTVIIEGKVSDE